MTIPAAVLFELFAKGAALAVAVLLAWKHENK